MKLFDRKVHAFLWVWLILLNSNSSAQTPLCVPCSIPCNVSSTDTVFDIHMNDGHVLQTYRSVIRDLIPGFTGQQQALRLSAWRNGHCVDTIVSVAAVASVSTGGLGSMGSPLVLPIYPSREISRVSLDKVSNNFIEITGLIGYGGSDTTARGIGFPSVYEGLEVLVAPFGTFLGEKTALALGGELLFENGRMRIPAMGQLRYTFLGSERIVDSTRYYPSACALQCQGDRPVPWSDTSFHEVPTSGRKDSTSYLIHDRTLELSKFRPFLYIEGAYVFNGSFVGAGKDPSINPQDYGQYFAGLGVGTPFLDHFTVSLGYRYMRLNLRTPCPTCDNKYVVNTNTSNSITLKVGIRL